MKKALAVLPWALLAATNLAAQTPQTRLSVRNELDAARPGEIVEVAASLLGGPADLAKLVVVDAKSGRELLAQAVDQDGDGRFDLLVFQADFAPRETKTFGVTRGDAAPRHAQDFRVYGRFVRERYDDFAWENDRIAFRIYGAALETWQQEPLTSSAVDVWSKRTRRLVVNDWYMVDDYHREHGEGGDFYPAGKTRGCGGSGLWRDGKLVVSKNFRQSRVLANGPLRLVFELVYPEWNVPGVSETKRVTLDAGRNLSRFESRYSIAGDAAPLAWAAGIRKADGNQLRADRERGILRTWEPQGRYGDNGHLGCAVVMDPAQIVDVAEQDGNHLVLARSAAGQPASYWAGAGWDKSGDFTGVGDWDAHLDDFARRLRSPLVVEIVKP